MENEFSCLQCFNCLFCDLVAFERNRPWCTYPKLVEIDPATGNCLCKRQVEVTVGKDGIENNVIGKGE